MSVFGGTSLSGDSSRWTADGLGEYSLFFVEHLATFTVANLQISPKLVLDRLFRSPPQRGIWTRERLQVRVDTQYIRYLDPQEGKVLEKFPLTLVHLPTYAFELPEPKQADVNNIFMFAVASKTGEPEMHILQCLNANAAHVAEDINAAAKAAIEMQTVERNNMTAASQVNNRHKQFASLLNKCFDDIEAFVAKLEEAARKPVLIQGKSGDPVKRSIVLPPQKDFIDIYQKHKFCFNVIARIKDSLFNPNAPDLISVLFDTLHRILENSKDYRLPTTVVSPLLTQEAVDLLYSCLKSEQVAMWHSFGDGWNIPRDKWNGYVAPYHPTFLDGWTPDYPVDQDAQVYTPSNSSVRESSPVPSEPLSDVSVPPLSPLPQKTRISWLDDLKSRNVKVLEVLESKVGKEPRELTIVKGELLEMVSDDRNHGIWCRNSEDQFGFVDRRLVAVYHFNQAGDRLPRMVQEPIPRIPSPTPEQKKPQAPPPPPPPPPAFDPTTSDGDSLRSEDGSADESKPQKKRGQVMYRSQSQQDLVLAELSSVLNELDRKKPYIKKTPEVFISKYSTPEEVQEWLEAKDFGSEIRKKLRTFNGDSLFQLRKDQCEKKFGREGSRLFSQITLQRKINNYNTVSNKNEELKTVLEKVRKKAEVDNGVRSDRSSRNRHDEDDYSDE